MMDSDRIKSWLGFGVIVAIISIVALLLRSTLSPQRPPQGTGPTTSNIPSNVAVRLQQSEFTGYDDLNRKVWFLRADKVDISVDRSRLEARGNVQAELYDAPTSKRRALVTAPFVSFSKLSKTLQAGGKIVCRTPGTKTAEDLTVEAQTLLWNVGAKQVVCPGAVKATRPSNRGTAAGRDLTLDLPTRAWSLKSFHGEFALPENQGSAPPAFTNPLKGLP